MTPRIERVTIYQDAATDDSADPSYTSYSADVPCDITSVSGEETFRGRQLQPGVSYVVEIDLDTSTKPDMKVVPSTGVYNGVVLYVNYVKHVPYRAGQPPLTWLYCREVVTT